MVHVKECPLVANGKSKRRGRASTEFYRNGVPQIYCYGFMNSLTGEPLKECQECLDWAYGDQVSRDISQSVEQESER